MQQRIIQGVKEALIIVDIQNDFLEGGALEVSGKPNFIINAINSLMDNYSLIISTQDFHPKNHISFFTSHFGRKPGDKVMVHNKEQILWPVHCVANTFGSELHKDLNIRKITHRIYKGIYPDRDSYSAFFDELGTSTELTEYLNEQQVKNITIVGLALDFCVKYSALDAIKAGFETKVILDATRSITSHPREVHQIIKELTKHKVKLI